MSAFTIAIIVTILYFVFWTVRTNLTNKIAKKKEEELPNEAKILECLDKRNYKELRSLGAKIFFFDLHSAPGHVVALTKKALIFRNQFIKKYVTPPNTKSSIHFFVNKIVYASSTTVTKNKSVVGRAMAGGAIAGGVGAVVGAASALSDGGKKPLLKHTRTVLTDFIL